MRGMLRYAGAVLAALIPLGGLSAAQAEDHRPCVSTREYNSAVGLLIHGRDMDRGELERRWDTRSDGTVVVPMFGHAEGYPRCGYSPGEAWYAVRFTKGGRHVAWTALWLDDDATLQGHPKTSRQAAS